MGSLLEDGLFNTGKKRHNKHRRRGTKADVKYACYLMLALFIVMLIFTNLYVFIIMIAFFIALGFLIKWLFKHYRYKDKSTDEQYILRLPKYGHGLRGMTTSEFANACGLDFNTAKNILAKYQKRGKVTNRISHSRRTWYLRDD